MLVSKCFFKKGCLHVCAVRFLIVTIRGGALKAFLLLFHQPMNHDCAIYSLEMLASSLALGIMLFEGPTRAVIGVCWVKLVA